MKRRIFHIIRCIPGIILGVLAVASAVAQKPVQHLTIDHCESYVFSVQDMPGDRYTWHLYKDLDWDDVDFAQDEPNVDPTLYFDDGMYQSDAYHPWVKVSGLEPGEYFLKLMVWDEVGCTNNLMVFRITVTSIPLSAAFDDPGEQCYGDPMQFQIVLTGRGPYEVIYTYGDGTAQVNLVGEKDHIFFAPKDPLEPGETEFWIMEVRDECTVISYPVEERPTMKVIINPIPHSSDIYIKEEEP